MLKMKSAVNVIVMSFPGLSPDSFSYIEHKNSAVSLLDGTSATEELQDILGDFVELQENGKGHSIITQKKITSVKQALLIASPAQAIQLNAILADGRAFQEKEREILEKIDAAIGDIKTLIIWAKMYDEVGEDQVTVAPALEEIPKAAPAEHNWIDGLIADLLNGGNAGGEGGCCGFCDRDLGGAEEAQLEEVEKATSGKRLPTLQEYMQETIDAAGTGNGRAFLEGLRDQMEFKEARPDIVGDFMRGMFGRSDIKMPDFKIPENTFKPKASKTSSGDHLFDKLKELSAKGGPRVIRVGSIDELADLLGLDKKDIQLVPVTQ